MRWNGFPPERGQRCHHVGASDPVGTTEALDCQGDVAFFPVGLYEIKDQVIGLSNQPWIKAMSCRIFSAGQQIQRPGRH
ncbi:MAG: hypothetical protein ACLSA6_07320 [Holdemania massiliensis]